MKQYIVDAFTTQQFKGNPAAVCVLENDIPDELMQKIAIENNLSETAFVKKEGQAYRLRWFTPGCEVSLCGHATLATSFVLANFYEKEADTFVYETLSGKITVKRNGELFQLDMPAQKVCMVFDKDGLCKEDTREKNEVIYDLEELVKKTCNVTRLNPQEIYTTCDVVCVLENEKEVYEFQPDYEAIASIEEGEGLIITAPSEKYDFVSRTFYPKEAINEDPVCGSAHCSLVPYWSERLGKKELRAYQASARGGELFCEDKGERIIVSGRAVLYSVAEIFVNNC